MDTITCSLCGQVYEYEDEGTMDSMPDGYFHGSDWICDSCGSCPECGKSLEKEPEKRGRNVRPCNRCDCKDEGA